MSDYYAVAVGRTKGIFFDWPSCNAQVCGYQGSVYRKFTRSDAPNPLQAASEWIASNPPHSRSQWGGRNRKPHWEERRQEAIDRRTAKEEEEERKFEERFQKQIERDKHTQEQIEKLKKLVYSLRASSPKEEPDARGEGSVDKETNEDQKEEEEYCSDFDSYAQPEEGDEEDAVADWIMNGDMSPVDPGTQEATQNAAELTTDLPSPTSRPLPDITDTRVVGFDYLAGKFKRMKPQPPAPKKVYDDPVLNGVSDTFDDIPDNPSYLCNPPIQYYEKGWKKKRRREPVEDESVRKIPRIDYPNDPYSASHQ